MCLCDKRYLPLICGNLITCKFRAGNKEEARKAFLILIGKARATGTEGFAAEAFFSTYTLKEAYEEEYLNAAKYLAEKGAYINEKDMQGKTVLMYAIDKDSKETVEYLTEKGADVNAKDKNGIAVLMYASCPASIAAKAPWTEHATAIPKSL